MPNNKVNDNPTLCLLSIPFLFNNDTSCMSQKPGGEMRAQINSWGGVTDLKQSEDEWKGVVLCALACVKVGYALFREA